MSAFAHINGDHLLIDSCSWESYTGVTENASHGDKPATYATAATLACLVDTPGYRWLMSWPSVSITRALQLWLPYASTVKPQDRVTVSGVTYRVVDVQNWRGAGFAAMCERIDGIT